MQCYTIQSSDPLWKELCVLNTTSEKPMSPDLNHLVCGILLESAGVFRARAVCYLNPYHELEGVQYIAIGYVYCEDDFETFQVLSDAILEVAQKNDIDKVLGPMDGSTWNAYRLVSSEQEKPFLLEPVTPPYLTDFFQQDGWGSLAAYHSQYTDSLNDNWHKVISKYETFIHKGVQFSKFDKSKAPDLFVELATFCNNAFSKNFLFSPIATADFVAKMMPVLPILNPEFTLLARNKSGHIIGFIFAYEDLLNKENKTLVIKTLARDADAKYRGLGAVLLSKVIKSAKEKGFVAGIHALMLKTNVSTKVSTDYDGKDYRQYTLFSKSAQRK